MGANLVVVELAVAVVLLVGAGLLGQSFYLPLHVETGFDATHLATVQVMAPANVYTKDAQKVALYREIERPIGEPAGVESVGLTGDLPVQCNCDTDWIRIVGKPFHGNTMKWTSATSAPRYLETLKARLLRGGMFTEDDDASRPQAIVINAVVGSEVLSRAKIRSGRKSAMEPGSEIDPRDHRHRGGYTRRRV